MTRLKILFISYLLLLTSRAKSLKESTIDNENSNQAIKVTQAGLVNDKESITIYLKNDDILSISEFSKYYNPEEHHQTKFRFIEETDSDFVKNEQSKNDETTVENPDIEEYKEENKTDRNVDEAIVDSKEDISESQIDGLSTETNEVESTTISIKSQEETSDLTEDYENDLESPEHVESTESYLKSNVSNDDTNNDKGDDNMPTIATRRYLFPNEKQLLDNEGGISNKSVEIEKVDQDTLQEFDIASYENANDQSLTESTPETPYVHPPQQILPPPVKSQNQISSVSPLQTLKRNSPAGLSDISNEKIAGLERRPEILKITPDEYKQSNNLDKSGEISANLKSIDDYNSNIFENAYQYTPPKDKSMSQQPATNQPNINSLHSKLNQASEHPFGNRVPVRQNFGNYGQILPNYNLPNHYLYNFGPNFNPLNHYLQNVGPYNYVRRNRRHSSCSKCG